VEQVAVEQEMLEAETQSLVWQILVVVEVLTLHLVSAQLVAVQA
jgi:hypothetical protein